MVSLSNYQNFVADGYTKPSASDEYKLVNAALGLCGESGEVVDLIKKELHGVPISKNDFVEEIGDVMWYLAHLCNIKGIELEDVIVFNVNKIWARYPEQFRGCEYSIKED